jgi:hypothetical protein
MLEVVLRYVVLLGPTAVAGAIAFLAHDWRFPPAVVAFVLGLLTLAWAVNALRHSRLESRA